MNFLSLFILWVFIVLADPFLFFPSKAAPNGSFVDRPICVGDQNEVLEKSQLEAIGIDSYLLILLTQFIHDHVWSQKTHDMHF